MIIGDVLFTRGVICEKTVKDIPAMILEDGIWLIDFKTVDINGQYRHVTIPAQSFSEVTMTSGISLCRF